MNPSPLTTLAFTVEINAARAEKSYRNALQSSQQSENESGQIGWKMDRFDGGY